MKCVIFVGEAFISGPQTDRRGNYICRFGFLLLLLFGMFTSKIF